ncbi:transporter substrate-binding domain-containing protein [Amycolatopsis sp. FDAARGOS 1241]|nr:transporter substrate-binding domain-containing protein [Amycolatopsis sp. FDAARGOS 1241]
MAARKTTRVLFAAGMAASVVSVAACGPGDDAGSGYGPAEPGTITAGVTAGDAPFVSPDATGKPVGLLVDLNTVIARRMGLKITYRVTTVSAGLPLVTPRQPDILAIGMLPTPERRKRVDFTQPCYLASDDVVVRSESAVKAAGYRKDKCAGAGLGSAQVRLRDGQDPRRHAPLPAHQRRGSEPAAQRQPRRDGHRLHRGADRAPAAPVQDRLRRTARAGVGDADQPQAHRARGGLRRPAHDHDGRRHVPLRVRPVLPR